MTAKAGKVLDYKAMKPLIVDCRNCPFPRERNADLCTVCATKVVDEDGKVYVNPKPVQFYLDDNAPKSRRKTVRPKVKRRKKW